MKPSRPHVPKHRGAVHLSAPFPAHHRLLVLLLVSCGILFLFWGLPDSIRWERSCSAYQTLARSHAPHDETTTPAPETTVAITARDWDALMAINAHLVAWIQVDGTDIDIPVVQEFPHASGWYLDHDFWDNPSPIGCPYIESDVLPSARHLRVYGHHLWTGGAFSELQHAYEPETFSSLGTLSWEDPHTSSLSLQPLCALRVKNTDELVLRQGFSSDEDLRAWLIQLVSVSDTSVNNDMALVAAATRAISLITCSSDLVGQPWRTVVVFVDTSLKSP